MTVQTIDLLKTPTDLKKLLSFITKGEEVLLTEGAKLIAGLSRWRHRRGNACPDCMSARSGPATISTRRFPMSSGRARNETPAGYTHLHLVG